MSKQASILSFFNRRASSTAQGQGDGVGPPLGSPRGSPHSPKTPVRTPKRPIAPSPVLTDTTPPTRTPESNTPTRKRIKRGPVPDDQDDENDESEADPDANENRPPQSAPRRKSTGPDPAPKTSMAGPSSPSPARLGLGRPPGCSSRDEVETVLNPTPAANSSTETYLHTTWDFLNGGRRDAQGHSPEDPDFDPGTLRVPAQFLAKQTPAQRQWWEMKARHFDTVLFFKMGKFYELFHMDALIGVQACGMLLMKKEMAHCGFPESALQRYVDILVGQGYKVARIEQTETPQMMAARVQREGKKGPDAKAVRREICQIVSSGTRINSLDHDDCLLLLYTPPSMESVGQESGSCSEVGVAVFQPSVMKLFIGTLFSVADTAEILTLIQIVRPTEIVSDPSIPQSWKDSLIAFQPLRLRWQTSPPALEGDYAFLKEQRYGDDLKPFSAEDFMNRHAVLVKETSSKQAFLWMLTTLKESLIDQAVISNGDVLPLTDVLMANSKDSHLQFYGNALCNLDILPGKPEQKGLIHVLDRTLTASGKRLLRQWLAHPLANGQEIKHRQDILKSLDASIVQDCRSDMKGLGDLEKHLARLCLYGFKAKNHPDNRAILYETKLSSRLAKSLQAILTGFTAYVSILRRLLKIEPNMHDMTQSSLNEVHSHCEKFTRFLSKVDGDDTFVIPSGFNVFYDEVLQRKDDVTRRSEEFLEEQSRHFGTSLKFWGTGSNRFQLEVPESLAKKANNRYTLASQKKGFKRYSTSETLALCQEMEELEVELQDMHGDVVTEMVRQFSSHKFLWQVVIKSVAQVDCFFSLYLFNEDDSESKTLPHILSDAKNPSIQIRQGQHPILNYVKKGEADGVVIPNTIDLGMEMFILTGPNMGGKSTLMRQTALLVALAQLGVKVPAEEMSFYPVDKIFSRMGASDNIMEGKSTFLMELLETSTVFQNMTSNSLVLIDELGRGTSTYDGCAIALATLEFLAGKCRGLFSTHYHEIFRYIDRIPGKISLHYMDFMKENEDVVFLYQLKKGRCTESHGLNVAKLAGIPEDIIEKASRIAISKVN
ncbi:hypothetical protein TCAL_12766 [Tigriopus californicus]|uniref:DNA mismatch repair proteins mutS family domain-containing protein n=1 Tax=Tigriopus californicus TaxID=6832 RepID=A0A553PK06_TIGCA|nr:probable DNA mismatch repair protein Msh6 [Tigriopus californicus]TRY78012.1 hypothetical protein TCAL_12766 [Tigriopus californicus]|eukprot:TCALIF_12766-PA protein Name:"Similar to Msh6 Probable DNA mismatch repair protein Msh6 (Drosophila melanogaster)" AED:0.00 eAED:0.00 QI:376/1/1/1/1/1/2/40/1054